MYFCIQLVILTLFSFSAIHAEIDWNLSDDGTLTISGRNIHMPDYEIPFETPWHDDRLKIETVVIEDGVINIGKNAFFDCSNLSSITIPNSVTSIGDNAFYGCSGLTSVTIGNSVKTIGVAAFNGCSSLTSVTIGNSVTSIGGAAFAGCSSLTSITIPNSVTSIGQAAFKGCSSLTSITIPNSVTSIGDFAFEGCSNLTSITIGNSVTSIGDLAFVDCSSLTTIIVEDGNTEYDSRDNCNALIETNSNTLILGCKNSIIPNSVTSIGENAFSDCSGLTSITIPNSVTSIGEYAFSLCYGLTSVTIPNSVTSIGKAPFYGCSGLSSITFERSTPPEFGKKVFDGLNKSIPVYVPFGSIEAYKNALEGQGISSPNIKPLPLYLTGSESYTQNSQIDDIDVSFTRNFSGDWESICLPFSLEYKDWKDDFEVARINAVRQYDTNDDGDIDETVLEFVKMKSGSVIYPNTPYLIKSKNSGKKTISVENTTLYESKANSIECSTTTEQFTFIGLYKKPSFSFYSQTFISKYVMDEGLLSELTAQSNIGPYRWYMTRENRNSAYGINNNNTAKEISIRVVGEETTGVANIQLTSPNTQTYDLNGRKVNENSLKPGIYVKNGKKFVVK